MTYAEIEVVNSSVQAVNCGYNSHNMTPDSNPDNYFSVDAGKSKKFNAPVGCYIKYDRKTGGQATAGKVEYKGQVFRVE